MTKRELQQYPHLVKECEHLYQKIEQKERELTAIKSQQVKDMPSGGKMPTLEDLIIEIADFKEGYHQKYLETLRKRQEIENAIETITDSTDRLIFRLKYIEGLVWWQIANRVGYDETYTKKRHNKYFEHTFKTA